jgi:hypothetical protein
VDSVIEKMVEEIDKELEKIENHKAMKAVQKLLERKAKLQASRRALLGTGNRLTGEGGNRVTQAEVVAFFKSEGPGVTHSVAYIAEQMGHNEATIRGHLNRGKGERFTKHDDGTWSLRDPKNEPEEDDDE